MRNIFSRFDVSWAVHFFRKWPSLPPVQHQIVLFFGDPVHDPEKHNPEWTQSRMDTIPNGHNPEWTPSRKDTIPKGHNPE